MMMPPIALHVSYPFDPNHRFETSWLVSPKVFFCIRALVSLYAFVTLFFNIGYNCQHPERGGCAAAGASFSYFTVLSYWGLAFYFGISAYYTLIFARTGTSLLSSLPRALQWLHSAYASTATTFPFLVLIVFWGLLSSPTTLATPYSAWTNVSQHVLNAVFAAAEIALSRLAPAPWDHLPLHLVLLGLYLGLAYVTRATEGFYTYSFLDAGRQGPLVAAYVFGIAVGASILFAAVQGLVWLRLWLTEDKLGYGGVFVGGATDAESARAGRGAGKDEERHELRVVNVA